MYGKVFMRKIHRPNNGPSILRWSHLAYSVMQRSGVRPSGCMYVLSAYTQRDSPGGSTRRG